MRADRPDSPEVLPAVDRAAFVAAFSARLRARGVPVDLTASEWLTRALAATAPTMPVSRLYWTARITLTRRHSDLETFDALFWQIFGDATLAVDPHARRALTGLPASGDESRSRRTEGETEPLEAENPLPWATLPSVVGEAEASTGEVTVPLRLPSDVTAQAELPFERLDDAMLATLGGWLADAARAWPRRRSRRCRPDHRGRVPALRETLKRSRRTGWEPVRLVRTRPVDKPRKVVLLCDVSQSMRAQAPAYLHLMRALAVVAHTEVFAFSTSVTRLTSALAHRSPSAAIERATEEVTDRFGGTRIASAVRAVLSAPYQEVTRGAVVLIGSDGWDGDPPEELARAMAALRRRAHRVIWLNPRAGATGFEPTVAAMAAALPYCDALLPADTFSALRAAIMAIAGAPNPKSVV